MKAIIYSLISLGLLTTTGFSDENKMIEAKVISTTISTPLPKNLGYRDRPMGYRAGAKLMFFFQGENFVEFDKDTFQANGWDKNFDTSISRTGKSGSITIFNRKFKGILEELEVDGSIDVLVGKESKTKKLILKKDGEPVKFPSFTVELELNEDDDKFTTKGVKVVGSYNQIKSIKVMRNGKEIRNNGYSSSNKKKTFTFSSIQDGDEVSVEYWTALTAKTVKLYK